MSAATNTRTRVLAFLGALLACLGAFGYLAVTAVSKPVLAAPTITSGPAAATSATTANLAFTGPSGATFQCRLDAAAFAACASPKAYAGLAQGSHTFAVKALKAGDESAVTTWTWVVDTTAPPAPVLTAKPSNPSATANPSFAFTDTESGVTFRCSLDGAAFAACTSPKAFSGLAQGAHSFALTAVDAAGNVSGATTFAWTVDTVAPTAPTLTTKPTNPTSNATNTFAWTAAEGGLTFQCALENGSWFACTTPYTWVIDTDNYGQHQFGVRGIDAAGNASAATYYAFKYEKGLPMSGVPFQISGSVTGLTLGTWAPISVTVTNPNPVTIFVTALTVGVNTSADPAGCASGTNLELQQSNISPSLVLAVPANGSVTLPAQGVTRPQVRLRNLLVNQDACKGKSFALTYTGTANN